MGIGVYIVISFCVAVKIILISVGVHAPLLL